MIEGCMGTETTPFI